MCVSASSGSLAQHQNISHGHHWHKRVSTCTLPPSVEWLSAHFTLWVLEGTEAHLATPPRPTTLATPTRQPYCNSSRSSSRTETRVLIWVEMAEVLQPQWRSESWGVPRSRRTGRSHQGARQMRLGKRVNSSQSTQPVCGTSGRVPWGL